MKCVQGHALSSFDSASRWKFSCEHLPDDTPSCLSACHRTVIESPSAPRGGGGGGWKPSLANRKSATILAPFPPAATDRADESLECIGIEIGGHPRGERTGETERLRGL